MTTKIPLKDLRPLLVARKKAEKDLYVQLSRYPRRPMSEAERLGMFCTNLRRYLYEVFTVPGTYTALLDPSYWLTPNVPVIPWEGEREEPESFDALLASMSEITRGVQTLNQNAQEVFNGLCGIAQEVQ